MPGTCDVVDPPVVELPSGHLGKCLLTAEELQETPIALTSSG